MSADPKSTILARLSGEDPAARAALVRAATEHALAQPISTYVDRDSLVALARAAATEANAALLLSAHARPSLTRQQARSARLGETLGDLLPHDVETHMLAVFDRARLPNAALVQGIIDRKLVNQLVGPVVQQTLISFAKNLPIPGLGGAGGGGSPISGALFGSLAGSAGKLFDVGKSVVGGLSGELEKTLQVVAKDSAETVLEGFRVALRKRIESEEGKKILREIIVRALAKLRDSRVSELLAEVEALPAAEVDALVAATIAHNAPRSAVADALREEVAAFVAVEGPMTLGAFLDRAGIRSQVEAVVDARADQVLRSFFSSSGFASVLDLILA